MRTPIAALFSNGFRPFFLLAGLWAPIGVGLWVLSLVGFGLPDGPLPSMRWHAHELLTGFVGAAMIGFLTTAVPNWTGQPNYAGPRLIGLVVLFAAARLALLPGSPIPIGFAAPLALTALPATLLLVLPALIKAGTKRLLLPPAIILAFWAGDLLMLGDAAGWWRPPTWATGQMLAANVAMLLVGLLGGRVIPSFTLNALRKTGQTVEAKPIPGLDRAAMAALLAVVIVDSIWPGGGVAGGVAALAAVLLAVRLSRWHGLGTLGQPILWILHLAYGLLPVTLGIKAVWLFTGAAWAANWLHLQMAGALTLTIVAMMTRVALGHTGRDLVATPATVGAYVTLTMAMLIRVFGTAWSTDALTPLIVAAVLWTVGFGLYSIAYMPILMGPRVQGKKG
jgi:uncharacterized protein involved in response to NO